MDPGQELKLLRHIANIDTVLAAHTINAPYQTAQILAHLFNINSTLSAIDRNLTLLEMKK